MRWTSLGVLGHSSIKSVARMNSAVVIFVDGSEKVKWWRLALLLPIGSYQCLLSIHLLNEPSYPCLLKHRRQVHMSHTVFNLKADDFEYIVFGTLKGTKKTQQRLENSEAGKS